MCVALEVEQAVAGFVNTSEDGRRFDVDDVNEYIMSLWNAGLGPVRLNFTQQQLRDYLEKCRGLCLSRTNLGYQIDKSGLGLDLTKKELELLENDKNKAQSFALFCKLRVDPKTHDYLLDAMGFRFMYRE